MPDESYIEIICRDALHDDRTPSYSGLLHEERAGVVAELIREDLNDPKTEPYSCWGIECMTEVSASDRDPRDLPLLLAEILQAYSDGREPLVTSLSVKLAAMVVKGAVDYGANYADDQIEKMADKIVDDARDYDEGRGDYLRDQMKDDEAERRGER